MRVPIIDSEWGMASGEKKKKFENYKPIRVPSLKERGWGEAKKHGGKQHHIQFNIVCIGK
jgi:hypothetical protein